MNIYCDDFSLNTGENACKKKLYVMLYIQMYIGLIHAKTRVDTIVASYALFTVQLHDCFSHDCHQNTWRNGKTSP